MKSAAQKKTDQSETIISNEFKEAFEILEYTKNNLFITGKAGTGKSTFLKYFRENTRKKIAVVAPTGIAALNVNGQTVHSFFRLKPNFIKIEEIKPNRNKVLKNIDLIIIDEISMVRADVFDGIDHSLKLARKNNKPFGGIQICVIGDMFQLSPIVANDEKELFLQHYESSFFFSSKAYQSADFNTVLFNKIHRQNDEEFIQILNAIRSGNCDENDIKTLNTRHSPRATPAPGTLVLTSTNALAENINNSKLSQLVGFTKTYKGKISADFNLRVGRLPAAEDLKLKVGAQVMFVKNDSEMRWVNGTVGIVEKLEDDKIHVRVGSEIYKVEAEKWKNIGYEFDEDKEQIIEKQMGTYTQFPLSLAWAITIHKSQGKTLERVIIDLGNGAFAPGQLYVALSRCKSLSGIALKQPISYRDIKCDEQVVEFINGLR